MRLFTRRKSFRVVVKIFSGSDGSKHWFCYRFTQRHNRYTTVFKCRFETFCGLLIQVVDEMMKVLQLQEKLCTCNLQLDLGHKGFLLLRLDVGGIEFVLQT